jgi:hypothetical protein
MLNFSVSLFKSFLAGPIIREVLSKLLIFPPIRLAAHRGISPEIRILFSAGSASSPLFPEQAVLP